MDNNSPALNDMLNYLTDLYDRGYKYRTINVHRLALSFTLAPIESHNAGNHPLVCRLLKGVFNLRHPVKTIISNMVGEKSDQDVKTLGSCQEIRSDESYL